MPLMKGGHFVFDLNFLIDCEIDIAVQPPIDQAIGVVISEFDGATGSQQAAKQKQKK
jgi:hypothetical protein